MLKAVDSAMVRVDQKLLVGDSIEFEYHGKCRSGRVHMLRYDTWDKTMLVTIRESDGFKNYYLHDMKDFRNVTLDNVALA